jgi:hypothetical protein
MTLRSTWIGTTLLLAMIAFIVALFAMLALSRSTNAPPAPHVDFNGTGG